MPRSKQRTPELRERLLDTAIELLAVDGTAAVTTRRVADAADTSAPAIYELFGDKAGLVRAVFFEGFRRLVASLDEVPVRDGTTNDLLSIVIAFRRFTLANPRLFEVMYSKPFEVFTPGPDEQALGDTSRNILIDRSKACVKGGAIHGDPVDIAHAVLALSIGLATQETAGWLGSTEESRERRWVSATESLLRGYQHQPTEPPSRYP